MGFAKSEKEIADRTARFIKAELKRADMTYADLAEKLKEHGLTQETEASIKSKLARGTFAATFLIGVVAALEMQGVSLESL
jgi:lambda repressor-like predicted transcriptional regulator